MASTSIWQSLVLSHKIGKKLAWRLFSCLGCGSLWVLWQGGKAAGSWEGISKPSGVGRDIVQLLGGDLLTSKALLAWERRLGSLSCACTCTGDFRADESDGNNECFASSSASCRAVLGRSLPEREQSAAPLCQPPCCSLGCQSCLGALLLHGVVWGKPAWGLPSMHRSQAGIWGWHHKCKLNVYSVNVNLMFTA